MITPFGPPSEDLDRLNAILDAQVAGKRAPAPVPASDADGLAATARIVSGQSLDGREQASAETLDSIWRNVMHVHAIPDSAILTGDRPVVVRSSGQLGAKRTPDSTVPLSWLSWLSIAAMAVLLFGIVGGAWAMRGGNGGDDEPIRLAAISPLGTPETETDWLTWTQPEECTAEPMTTEEYAEVMREQPDISGRSYEVVGPANPETADAVAETARKYLACDRFGDVAQSRSTETDAYIFFQSVSMARTRSIAEMAGDDLTHAQYLSEQMQGKPNPAYEVIGVGNPPDAEEIIFNFRNNPSLYPPTWFPVPVPDNAVLLDDGRIAIPLTVLIWKDDPWFEIPTQEEIASSGSIVSDLLIFSNDQGEWRLDERLGFCNGSDCGAAYWNDVRTRAGLPAELPAASPVATPEG